MATWRTISFSDNGGSGTSPTTLYYQTANPKYWATRKSTSTTYRIYSLSSLPTLSGYIFAGFFTGTSCDGTQFAGSDGSLYTPTDPNGDITLYAGWRDYATITLDKGEYGTGGTASFYCKLDGGGFFSDTALTTPITSITPPAGAIFGGYKLDGVTYIDRNGNFTAALLDATITQDFTLTASWTGGVIDYFNLASDALVPIAATTGDTRHRVAVSHGGKYESGVNEVGKVWRNPSVTYVVKANTTVAVQLGKAWKPRNASGGEVNPGASDIAVSGYMITTVEIVTEVGKFPTVTISAVANEGANAVNNFTVNADKFNVSVPVVARSKAQNLLNAISGGGYLQRVALVGTCDPVVCEENLMPCASDIVNGRYELSAETLAANGEAAPAMAAASGTDGGFALLNVPRQERDCDFVRYTIQARREMV